MDFLNNTYYQNPGLYNVIIGALIFYGLGRIAFWRNADGLHVGGPLAVGLALLLTIAITVWAEENGRSIAELGPMAAGLVVGAIVTMGIHAFRKSGQS
ncbi:MAG: hypothetical protein HZB26_00690 [Candidatus Hydrogenedentes bacterium]|nr:hypothetical protein [Candidatus Hydrogenedentota bacterium]